MNKAYGIKTKTKKGKKYSGEEVDEFILKAFLEGINSRMAAKKKIRKMEADRIESEELKKVKKADKTFESYMEDFARSFPVIRQRRSGSGTYTRYWGGTD